MRCEKLILQIPTDLRFGQAIFNFLEWCKTENLLPTNQLGERVGDPFSLPDKFFMEYWDKWLESLERKSEI